MTLCDLWTVACQALLSMGFSRQKYWNGLPCPPPGDIPNSEIKPISRACSCVAGRLSLSLHYHQCYVMYACTLEIQKLEHLI